MSGATRNSAEISWQARDQETETSDMVIKIRLTTDSQKGYSYRQ